MKRRLRKTKKPPTTKRYCPVCDSKTEFSFDKGIGHSSCVLCGFRWIKGMPREPIYKKE